jgi:hypothetical protein
MVAVHQTIEQFCSIGVTGTMTARSGGVGMCADVAAACAGVNDG